MRLKTGDRKYETKHMRQEKRRLETGDMRHETGDVRQET